MDSCVIGQFLLVILRRAHFADEGAERAAHCAAFFAGAINARWASLLNYSITKITQLPNFPKEFHAEE
jgi:hypothetical protein